MLENLILKKSKISGVAQNGSISAYWIFRVANGNYPPAATLLYVADQIKLMFYLEL